MVLCGSPLIERQIAIEKIKAEYETMSSSQSNIGVEQKKGKGKGTNMLGRSPPCSSFMEMITIFELAASTDKFLSCDSKADMLALQKANRTKKKPINELNASCNSTLVALKKAFDKTAAMADAGVGKGKGKGRGGRGRGAAKVELYVGDAGRQGAALFDFAPDGAVEVPVVDAGFGQKESSEFKPLASFPLMMRLMPEDLAQFTSGDLHSSLETFGKDFAASDDRLTKRRGGRKLPENSDSLTQARDIMTKLLPVGSLDISDECIQSQVGPAWFAVTKGELQVVKEPDCLPTLRLTVKGTRTLIMARIGDLLDFMKASGIASENLMASRVCSFMKAMNSEQIAAFKQKYKFHFITSGVGNVVYVPAAWVIAEKTGDEDVYGMSFRGLVPADEEAVKMIDVAMTGMKDPQSVASFQLVCLDFGVVWIGGALVCRWCA